MTNDFQRYRPAIPPNFQESFRLYLLEELDKISQSFSSLADAELGTISTTDDLTEGTTNLYFTDERVDDRVNGLLQAGTNVTLTYNDVANTLTIDSTGGGGGSALTVQDEGVDLNNAVDQIDFIGSGVTATNTGSSVSVNIPGPPSDTDSLPEGLTNLYFTGERVDDRVSSLLQAGTNVSLVYDDAGNTLTVNSTVPAQPSGQSQSFIAEESATISTGTSNGFQWSYGNGELTLQDEGIPALISGRITALGLDLPVQVGDSATVELYVNGVATGATVTVSEPPPSAVADVDVAVTKGDLINFRTVAATGAPADGRVAALLVRDPPQAGATVVSSGATTGQIPVFNEVTDQYEPQTISTGGGSSFGFNPPLSTNFTVSAFNAATLSATTDDSDVGLILEGSLTNIDGVVAALETAPTAPYTITAKISFVTRSQGHFLFGGLVLRNSATGQTVTFGDSGQSRYGIRRGTVFPNDLLISGGGVNNRPVFTTNEWFRVVVDSSNNYTFQMSTSGKSWRTVNTESSSVFSSTPDQIGIGFTSRVGSFSDVTLTVPFYEVT